MSIQPTHILPLYIKLLTLCGMAALYTAASWAESIRRIEKEDIAVAKSGAA